MICLAAVSNWDLAPPCQASALTTVLARSNAITGAARQVMNHNMIYTV